VEGPGLPGVKGLLVALTPCGDFPIVEVLLPNANGKRVEEVAGCSDT